MTGRSRALFRSLLAILLIVAVLLSFQLLYDPAHLKGLLLEQMEQSLGRKVEIGHASLELFPRPRIKFSDIVIRDRDPSGVFVKAKRFDLILRVLPLFKLKVVGKRLLIDQPQVDLRRDSSGDWNFVVPQAAGVIGDGAGDHPFSDLWLVQETRVSNGSVTVVDEFRPDGVRTIHITRLDLTLSMRPEGLPAELGISATVSSGGGSAALSIVGQLARSGATATTAPDTPALILPTIQFDGSTEVIDLDLRQLMDFFGPRPVPEEIHGLASLRSRIRIAPGVSGYDLLLTELSAEIDDLKIDGQGSLSGLMTAQPTFSLTISSAPVSLHTLLEYYPAQWLPLQVHEMLVERDITGVVEAVTATMTGSTMPEPQVSLTGEFRVREGHMVLGRDRTAVQDLSATILLEPDRIRVVKITGMHGALRVSDGTVSVSFPESEAWLQVELSGDIAATDLVQILAKNVRSAPLAKTFTQLRNVTGDVAVTFQQEGAWRDPDGLKFVGGNFITQEVGFRSPALPKSVMGLNGRVQYSKEGFAFEDVIGRMGQSEFRLHGTVTTAQGGVFKGFTVRATADASELVSMLPIRAQPHSQARGRIGAAISLSGPVSTPKLKGVFELQDIAIDIPGLLQKPIGLPASLSFDGALSGNNVLSVHRAEFTLAGLRLTGKGKVRLGKRFVIDVAVLLTPISLSRLPRGVAISGVKAGTLELSLEAKGIGTNWKAWELSGWVALTDGLIPAKGLDSPLENVYLRAKLVRHRAELKRLEFRIKESRVRVSGTIRDWNTTPNATLEIQSPQLDLDLLIPKGKRSPVRDMLERLAATSRVVVDVRVKRGVYEQMTLRDLTWRATIADETLHLDQIHARTDEGTVAGSLRVKLPKQKPAEGALALQVNGMPFQEFTHLLGTKQHPVRGQLVLNGSIRGHGRNPDGVTKTLSGTLSLRIDKGRILKMSVISKILGLLNLPALLQGKVDLVNEGMPFDKITGTISIKNGVLTSENLLVDSPIMKISTAGSYDPASDQLDAIMAVSPFGSYSKLLQSIPLFGKLFAGERKSIVTAVFEVKGPLEDPEVTYLPIDSLASGIGGLAEFAIDVLKNTLTLPVKLMQPDEESAREPPLESDEVPASVP
ncbi:MAG: AsmA-like C-terminal domain-containing protein [Nitrospirae bacterium]|nr:AsmA-like C-terminal domain-containing protein [Nitrospirota bacterium]